MRTQEEMESITQHPSYASVSEDVSTDGPSADEEDTAHRSFFVALEELEQDILVYGTASIEARVARDRVKRMRDAVAEAWRKEKDAA